MEYEIESESAELMGGGIWVHNSHAAPYDLGPGVHSGIHGSVIIMQVLLYKTIISSTDWKTTTKNNTVMDNI